MATRQVIRLPRAGDRPRPDRHSRFHKASVGGYRARGLGWGWPLWLVAGVPIILGVFARVELW